MGFFDKIDRSGKFTVIYLTPSAKLLIVVLHVVVAFLSFIAYDYTSTRSQGDRFTSEDGVFLSGQFKELS